MNPHLFIGLPVNETLKACALTYQSFLKGERCYKRLMHPDDLHLTLAFLGATPLSVAETLWKDLERHLSGFTPFVLSFTHIDGFGNPDYPRVIYLAPQRNERLTEVKAVTDECLITHGLQVSDNPFRPHVTMMKKCIGREDSSGIGKELPLALSEPVRVEIERICLYRVHPGKTPSYEVAGEINGSR